MKINPLICYLLIVMAIIILSQIQGIGTFVILLGTMFYGYLIINTVRTHIKREAEEHEKYYSK